MATKYTPTVKEVSAFVRSRTPDRWGDEQTEFNAETRPTKTQVEELIDDAVNEVSGSVGDLEQDKEKFPCVERMRDRAKSAAILYTAMLIELGYFPEQTSGPMSAFDRMEKLYEKKIERLTEAVSDCVGGDGLSVGEEGASKAALPSGNFEGLDGVGERAW